MMTKTFAKGSLALVLVGGLLASSYGCDQPKPKCAAGRGAFATVFTPTSGPPSCADTKGEQFGISTYNAIGPRNRQPNLDVASIAIQPTALGTLVENAEAGGVADPDTTHTTYALGFFATAEPGDDDFCRVPTLTNSFQAIPEYADDPDNEITGAPATTVEYKWSNVRFYVTPEAIGTQFAADLIKTVDGVACGYSVQGMYPYIECGKADPNDDTNSTPDEGACAPEADIDAGRPTGSGISPDFPTKCDPDQLVCVLAKPVPALK